MQILIEDDEGQRSVVPGVPEEVTIGRKDENAICLPQRNVSRRHARLARQKDQIYIEDVDARYGIQKNGQTIDDRAPFTEGDVVTIGGYRLTLRAENAVDVEPGQNEADVEIDGDLERRIEAHEPAPEPEPVSSGTTSEASERSSTEVLELDPAELVVVSSNFAGQTFPLDQEEIVIGRGEECDIIIDHRSVSTTHAKIVRQSQDNYKIVDLNSSNGVKVSGKEYKSTHLERGDIIQLGHVKFRFVEPGENYTFTPQDEQRGRPVAQEATGTSSDNTMMLVGGAALAVLLLLVGGFVLLSGGGSGESDGSKSASATPPDKGMASAGASATGSESESSESNDKVDRKVDEAETRIEEGKLDQAIGSLESIQDLLEPTAEQGERINELLSRARSEQPYRRAFDEAQGALEDDESLRALSKIESIPNHSVFYDISRERDMRKEALDQIFKQAEASLEEGELDRTENLMKQAIEYGARAEEAEDLLDRVEKVRQQRRDQKKKERERKRMAQREESQRGGSSGGSPSNTGGAATTQESGSGAPDDSEESGGDESGDSDQPSPPDNPRQLKRQAMKKILKGKLNEAIQDCQSALRAGHIDCYRVLGLAYNKLDNNARACQNFKKYLDTNPQDAGRIRRRMGSMGCN